MKRIAILVLAFVMLAMPSTASAVDGRPYHWSERFHGFVDDRCDSGFYMAKIKFREHNNFGGAKLKICGYVNFFGWYKRYRDVISFINWDNAISSFKVVYLADNSCLNLYTKPYGEGKVWTLTSEGKHPVMPVNKDGFDWNDQIDSMYLEQQCY